MSSNSHKNIFSVFTVLALFVSTYGLVRTYQHGKLNYLQGTNIVYKDGQVLGINSTQATASSDFNKPISQGSPLIFGGAHYPKLEQRQAWDQIQAVGVTSLRSDFYLDRYLPQNTTIENYKNNVNGVADPKNWNQTNITLTRNVYKEAKKRNMQTIGVATYAIKWLTYSGTNYGVPKDWGIYEDLVRKSYSLYRDDLDYLEVWNEPDMDFFLDVKNSGLTKDEAYYQIVRHAVTAIRQVDAEKNDGKKMKIGVGVISRPTTINMIDKVFADSSLMSQIDFVSYHNYEHIQEPTANGVRNELQKFGASQKPLQLTEWAHSPELKKQDAYVLSNLGISYAGSKFISYFNTGLQGANYFALQQIDPLSKRGDEGYLGFFTETNGKDTLLPISKTWMLMSKTLALGSGASTIYQSNPDSQTDMATWKNINGEYGLVISNESNAATTYNVSINNYPVSGQVLASAYVASSDQDGSKKLGSIVVTNQNNQMSLKVVAPSNSVIGVKFGAPSLLDRIPTLP